MRLPSIKFSPWLHWSERKKIKNSDYPGVYLLAKFRTPPKGNADVLDANIIYIGETCRTLGQRLYEFDRSAFQGKDGHSGGWEYADTYGDTGHNLYVATLPVINELEGIRHLFIRYVERRLILEYAVKHGKEHLLNTK